jgi:branched-chain amino acid transport system substrate-binding protein
MEDMQDNIDVVDPPEEQPGISRKGFLKTSAFSLGGVGIAGALAACGRSDDDDKADAQSTTNGSAASGTAKALLLGCPFPLSGPFAGDGADLKAGAEIAAQEINDAGGVGGRKIELNIVDCDPSDPADITKKFKDLVNQKVDGIWGGYQLAWPPSHDATVSYGCPFLNGDSAQAQIDKIASDPDRLGYIFQISTAESLYGLGFITFLDGLVDDRLFKPRARTIHILEGDSAYSQTISKVAQEAAKKADWKIVGVDPVRTGASDWSSLIAKVKSTNPGVVMDTHLVPADVAAFQKQWVANPTDSLVYLQYAPAVPQFLELAGDAAEGVIWSTTTGYLNDFIGKRFQDKFREVTGRPPALATSGMSYDAVHIFARAWGMVGDPKDFPAVVKQIKTMRHRGINGSYWMERTKGNVIESYPSENEDPGLATPLQFFQIQKVEGKLENVVIAPEPYIEGQFKKQPWMSS